MNVDIPLWEGNRHTCIFQFVKYLMVKVRIDLPYLDNIIDPGDQNESQ